MGSCTHPLSSSASRLGIKKQSTRGQIGSFPPLGCPPCLCQGETGPGARVSSGAAQAGGGAAFWDAALHTLPTRQPSCQPSPSPGMRAPAQQRGMLGSVQVFLCPPLSVSSERDTLEGIGGPCPTEPQSVSGAFQPEELKMQMWIVAWGLVFPFPNCHTPPWPPRNARFSSASSTAQLWGGTGQSSQ